MENGGGHVREPFSYPLKYNLYTYYIHLMYILLYTSYIHRNSRVSREDLFAQFPPLRDHVKVPYDLNTTQNNQYMLETDPQTEN